MLQHKDNLWNRKPENVPNTVSDNVVSSVDIRFGSDTNTDCVVICNLYLNHVPSTALQSQCSDHTQQRFTYMGLVKTNDKSDSISPTHVRILHMSCLA